MVVFEDFLLLFLGETVVFWVVSVVVSLRWVVDETFASSFFLFFKFSFFNFDFFPHSPFKTGINERSQPLFADMFRFRESDGVGLELLIPSSKE